MGCISENFERKHFTGFDLLKLTPEHPSKRLPVLIAPGYRSAAGSFTKLMWQLSDHGYTSICIDYMPDSKDQPKVLGLVPDVNRVKQQALVKAFDMYGDLTESGVRRMHFIGHSKGAFDGMMFAKEQPESFGNCVLVAPRGLMPPRNIATEAYALIAGERRNGIGKKQYAIDHPELAKVLADIRQRELIYKRDNIRYLVEMLYKPTQTIPEQMNVLRSKGSKIVVVAQAHDGYYPVEEIKETLKNNGNPVDGFAVVAGLHSAIKYDPTVCRAVSNFLCNLEVK